MNNLIVRNTLRFLLLMLLQVLVLNQVYLGGFINPFLYVLFILMLPTNTNRMLLLLLAFLSGFCVDIFSNILGFHTMAATTVAFCRILFADRILTRGEQIVIETPSIQSTSFQQIAFYFFVLFFIYNFLYFLLEIFSFRDFWDILLSTTLSTLVVWILALLYQTIFLREKKQ